MCTPDAHPSDTADLWIDPHVPFGFDAAPFQSADSRSRIITGNGEMEMRAAWRLSLIGLIVAGYSVSAQAQIYRGNDTGGIIPWSCENEADARYVAGAYCASWGKYARITSVHRMYGQYITFNCLWRPGIARYQLPAVGTRSSCYAHARRLRPHISVRY
jgi:hypothetical protein